MADGKTFLINQWKEHLITFEKQQMINEMIRLYNWFFARVSLFWNKYKTIATDIEKLQELDADQKVVQQINLTLNLDQAGNTTMLFILKEAKENILDFSQRTVRLL